MLALRDHHASMMDVRVGWGWGGTKSVGAGIAVDDASMMMLGIAALVLTILGLSWCASSWAACDGA